MSEKRGKRKVSLKIPITLEKSNNVVGFKNNAERFQGRMLLQEWRRKRGLCTESAGYIHCRYVPMLGITARDFSKCIEYKVRVYCIFEPRAADQSSILPRIFILPFRPASPSRFSTPKGNRHSATFLRISTPPHAHSQRTYQTGAYVLGSACYKMHGEAAQIFRLFPSFLRCVRWVMFRT